MLILAQRHPLRAAKELSTIDLLSGGRLIVGVGAGHVPEEYELLTGGFDERGRHTDEAVAALARCFTDEFPELPGPRFPASDMGLGPRPVRQPRPPIWIGGSSPAAIRRTAAFGDGWLPQGTRRRDLPGQIARLRELRAELRGGAPIDIGTIVEPIYLTVGRLGLGRTRLGALGRRGRGGDLAAGARGDGREPPASPIHGPQCRGILRADGALRRRSGTPAEQLNRPRP